jgi:transcriptional regulator GlxA family with amidase domain
MLLTSQTNPSQIMSDVCWTPTSSAHPQLRRVLITTQSTQTGIDAELIRYVFDEANRMPEGERAYSVESITFVETYCNDDYRSEQTGCHTSIHTLAQTFGLRAVTEGRFDTIFITGPNDPSLCELKPKYLEWLMHQCAHSRRVIAVAGGVIYLAAMGLLRGRVAVSHWSLHRHVESKYPGVAFRCDILYTRDGKIYTCAGGLASVDLALMLVEDDRGSAAAAHVAKQMVLPHRRTAICSQVSPTLHAQNSASHPISELIAWLPAHLTSDLSVFKLARRVAMSPRNFSRRFREQMKMTPAKYIEELRFEAAKRELVREGQSIVGAADRSGFKNAESLRRLFRRRLQTTPQAFRDLAAPHTSTALLVQYE